jgi:hypothetical protein
VEGSVRARLGAMPEASIESVLVAQKWHDTLTPNVPLQFGLNTADGYDGGVLPLLRWLNLSSLVVPSPRPDGVLLTRLEALPSAKVLDLLGVRYVIANAGTPGRADMQLVDFGDLRLFVRPNFIPRSLVVFEASAAADEAAALERMQRADFDPNREVVLESAAPTTAPAEPLVVQPDQVSPEAWHAHVSLSQPGYLLQREAWYPGWRARVDGVEAPMLRADVLFRAVPLSPGDHDVDIFFDSAAFRRGGLISLAGVLVVIVLFSWRWLPIMRGRVEG